MTNNISVQVNKKLNPPTNTDLPFFSYGIFKPGQLAYSKIKKYVERYEEHIINYEMKERDGVPILCKSNEFTHTKGNIIYFKENKKELAYKKISKTLSAALYEWKTIKIGEEEVNILFGANPDLGSNSIEKPFGGENYDGKKDPFFSDAIKLIEMNLKNPKYADEITYFFKLQMNYMLLWSAIDRYTHLKYNKNKEKYNRKELSKEKSFKKALKKHAQPKERSVYSATDIAEHEFNLENPYHCINYYYTIRCNVVHRGKIAPLKDTEMLKEAIEELLAIFKDVLEDTFKQK